MNVRNLKIQVRLGPTSQRAYVLHSMYILTDHFAYTYFILQIQNLFQACPTYVIFSRKPIDRSGLWKFLKFSVILAMDSERFC